MVLKMINDYLECINQEKIDEVQFLAWLEKNPPEIGSFLSRLPDKKRWLSIKVEVIGK